MMRASSATTSSARPSAAGKRIAGLDTARALAIALAMLSHSFIHFGVWPLLPHDGALAVRLFTRSATPTFIILFGMMLEIAYLKILLGGNRHACWIRLLTRAIQCYLLYLCVVVAGVLGNKLSPGEGARAALFLSSAYFANILKFYSLGLVFGILLVELRALFGLRAVGMFFAVIWLSYPLIKALPAPPESLAYFASYLIGAGTQTGPSVWQGLSLAILGMFLGHAALGFASPDDNHKQRARRLLTAVVALIVVAIVGLVVLTGFRPALENFTDYSYRAMNHPGYYILGSALASVLIAGCILVAARMSGAVLTWLNVFGLNSLFAYASGNVVLNILPPYRGDLPLGLLWTTVFLACLYGATTVFQRIQRVQARDRAADPVTIGIGRLSGRMHWLTVQIAALFVNRLLPNSPTTQQSR